MCGVFAASSNGFTSITKQIIITNENVTILIITNDLIKPSWRAHVIEWLMLPTCVSRVLGSIPRVATGFRDLFLVLFNEGWRISLREQHSS